MTERSRFWDGSTTGDAVSITDDEFMGRYFRALLNGTGDQGVLPGWLNELEVTDGGVDTASVNTGGAILYGLGYQSDAAVNVNINAYRGGNCLIIVRASWATQTARIVARAVGALTQTAGVTYEIPLANVAIDGAGAITLITDTRDYCEFSTELRDDSVEAAHLQDNAVTTAKLENQNRWVTRGAGELKADATNPATWVYLSTTPRGCLWEFSDAATDTVWCTLRTPADINSATMTVYVWTRVVDVTGGDVVWEFSSWDAAASAVLANQTGSATVTYAFATNYNQPVRSSLGTITVSAGDIIHVEIYRDGTDGSDTLAANAYLYMVEFHYVADS